MDARRTDRLAPGTAHLWVADLANVDELAVEGYQPLLSEEELERAQRFRFQRDRVSFVVSHGLLRTALTWAVPDVRPEHWMFTKTPEGRPEISVPGMIPRPRFSISHARGLVACVITADSDCGVDVEFLMPLTDLQALSDRVLSPQERFHVAGLPDAERLSSFFRRWTLKEAYAKARGLGMSLPFERLSFGWNEDEIRLHIEPHLDDGGPWYFEQWRTPEGYVIAVALRCGIGECRRVVYHPDSPS